MTGLDTIKKGWALLEAREKQQAWLVLTVIIIAGLMSALMVGSIFPFLSVLADTDQIQSSNLWAWLYESGGFSSEYNFLVALGSVSVLVIVLTNLILLLRSYIVARYSMMRTHSISRNLFRSYLEQPYEYFLDRHSADLATRMLSETQMVVHRFFRPMADAISSIVTLLAIVILLFIVDPIVTLLAFSSLGLVYVLTVLSTREFVSRLGTIRAEANAGRFKAANESLSGMKEIKLFTREGFFLERYSKPSIQMANTQAWIIVLQQAPQYLMQIFVFGGMIALCLSILDPTSLSETEWMKGLLPIVGVFAFAVQRAMPELSKLYAAITALQYSAAAVEAVRSDLKPARNSQAPLPPSDAKLPLERTLQLENVSYKYPGASETSITDLSLAISKGESIGVVGSTGAGKTTFVDIVLGLLQPQNGELLVDGNPITPLNAGSWRRSVGYVPQEIFLTSGSVSKNIAFGRPLDKIDQHQIVSAAQTAQIHEYIVSELPDGYDTQIGERGVRLSGGQRQRIGIARALYNNPDLIVFDEATSALDNLTERELMQSIEEISGERTILMIAHRLSTVRKCDRIILLNRGRIEKTGSWDELSAGNEIFRALIANTDT